jgi:hypothetical protein
MVATDGRRLTTANSLTLPISRTVIVPRNKFLSWTRLAGESAVGVHRERPLMRFVCGEWDTTVRLIEGTYPNWRQVVPDSNSTATRFSVADADAPLLLEALKTLPGNDQSSKPVTLMTGKPNPRIAACDPDSGVWNYQMLSQSSWDGDEPGITVNRDFLADALKAGFRTFDFQDDMSPLLARYQGNTHVLMPVRGSLPPEVEEAMAKRREQALQAEPVDDDQEQQQEANDEVHDEVEIEPPIRKEINRMIQPKHSGRTDDPNPDLWTQYQAVKEKARELNSAINELGQSIKGFHKEQKTVRVELDNARGVLAKLQSINI